MTTELRAAASGKLAGRGGLLLILLAAVLWGTVGVSTRAIFALTETTALSVAFLRLALAVPVLGAASVAVLGRRSVQASPRHLLLMGVIGILLAIYQLCFFGAIQRVGVTIATLVTLCIAPVIVAVLSPLLFGERLTRRLVLSAALAITGTVLLVSPIDLTALGGTAGTGLLLALGSALGYALVAIVSRSVARHAHPLTPVTVGFAVGALVLLPAMLFDGPRLDFPPVGWLLLVYLAVVPSALAYVLFTVGMRTTLATVASLVTLIEPLTAAGLAWLLFDERLGPLALVGAGLLLGAVWLLARE
jgi:DME family drug/metabolite transporter